MCVRRCVAELQPGAPRPRFTGAATAVLLLAIIVFAPWNSLIVERALPDSFGLALVQWAHWTPADTVAIGAAALLLIFVMLPDGSWSFCRRWCSSRSWRRRPASNLIADGPWRGPERAGRDAAPLGRPAATVPVAYLLNDPGWNVVWQQRFWNHRINDVFTLAPSVVPGPMKQNV